jgi:hypothetical protein
MIETLKSAFRRKKRKKLTEKDKSDIVIKKIINGQSTDQKDLQIFANNSEYIEQKLRELTAK